MIDGIRNEQMDYNPFFDDTVAEIERVYLTLLPGSMAINGLHAREIRFLNYLTTLLESPEESWDKEEIRKARNMLTICTKVLRTYKELMEPRKEDLLAKLYKLDIVEASEKEDGDFLFKLGCDYLDGKNGALKNEEQAIKLFIMASDKGDLGAKYNAAVCCLKGCGIQQDVQLGFNLLFEVAERGDILATYTLGCCYEEGHGTEVDYEWAFKCFEAASQHLPAMYDLARCYECGIGTTQSLEKARELYQIAADKGYQEAFQALEKIREKLKQ